MVCPAKTVYRGGVMKFSLRGAGVAISALVFLSLVYLAAPSFAQRRQLQPAPTGPWMNASLSPDERADLVLKELTLDEKGALLHGVGMPTDEAVTLENAPS